MGIRALPRRGFWRLGLARLGAALAVFLHGCAPEGGPSTFSKSYGGSRHDSAAAVVATEDGGFLLVGTADARRSGEANIGGGGDLWVQKLDADGDVEVSRLIGERPVGERGTGWARARPTEDGGAILVGTNHVSGTGSEAGKGVVDEDVAVTKLDAGGNVEWARTYDSGPWLNYEYFSFQGGHPNAFDTGADVWPIAGGGYWIVARSVANLRDALGIGFPCDEELNEVATEPCENPPPETGSDTYLGAVSVVAIRLDAGGEIRFLRRLTDGAFSVENQEVHLSPIIRSTHDGGAVLARQVDGGMTVHRLLGDGSPLWRRVLEGETHPSGLEQTDDPGEGGRRDRMRDDGFVLSVSSARVIKLDPSGNVEWDTDLDLGESVRTFILDVHQRCLYARPVVCEFLAVGSIEEVTATSTPIGYVRYLSADGDPLEDAATQGHIVAVHRVAGDAESTDDALSSQALAASSDGRRFLLDVIRVSAGPPSFRNQRPRAFADGVFGAAADDRPIPHSGDLIPGGGALILAPGHTRLRRIDDQGALVGETLVASRAERAEHALAGVEVDPNAWVLAGSADPLGDEGEQADAWVMRYELSSTGDRVAWQRRLGTAGEGLVTALVSRGDGGVVLGGRLESRPAVAALDGAGNLLWLSPEVGLPLDVERASDDSFAVVSVDSDGPIVTRLDADGDLLWRKRFPFPLTKAKSLATSPDRVHALAAADGRSFGVIRFDSAGEVLSARSYRIRIGIPDAKVSGVLIRATSDGGYVLAMTEKGLLNGGGGDRLQPLGQSNVLVVKLDAEGAVEWGRIYGALHHEGARDLAVLADGGIAVAGYSDSLGEGLEAWLLKLGSDGLIGASACQALLASLEPERFEVTDPKVIPEDVSGALETASLSVEDTSVPPRSTDFVTAEQCGGGTNPPATTAMPTSTATATETTPTPTPTATSTPSAAATVTPEPTALPVPTSTPTPTSSPPTTPTESFPPPPPTATSSPPTAATPTPTTPVAQATSTPTAPPPPTPTESLAPPCSPAEVPPEICFEGVCPEGMICANVGTRCGCV